MSDDFIIVVPADPTLVPPADAVERVTDVLKRLAPQAECIAADSNAGVQFFDCGENFESVSCAKCGALIDLEWWHERMSEDAGENGFELGLFSTRCCGARLTLNDLAYDWPQAFARFRWEVRNPNIGALGLEAEAEIAHAAAVPIKIVRQHR